MKTATLTKSCLCAVATASSLLTLGLCTPANAGPERLSDNSKDKVQMVQEPEAPKWFISGAVGVDFDTGATNFSNGFHTLISVNEAAAAAVLSVFGDANTSGGFGRLNSVEIDIKSHTWDDAYEPFFRVQGEIGRVFCNRHLEIYGLAKFTHADSETVTGSNVTLHFSNGDFEIPFTSRFSDYNAFGGELGARWLFCSPEHAIRPYVSVNGGAVYVDSIDLHTWTNVFGQSFDIFKDTFYDSSIVGTVSGILGVESRVTRRFSVGAEVGLRYETQLDGVDLFASSGLSGTSGFSSSSDLNNLKKINDAGDRLVIPVSFFAKLRF
jgi:hypothetical protein